MINPAKFLLSFLTEDEDTRQLPQEFIQTSVNWMRSWLAKNDPMAEAVLDASGPYNLKVKLVTQKLAILHHDVQFVRELEEKMAAYEQLKNLLPGSTGKHKDNALTDGSGSHDQSPGMKNVIKGSNISVGGNMQVGDRITHMTHHGSGSIINGEQHVVNNYSMAAKSPHTAVPAVKQMIRDLIAKGEIEEAVTRLVDHAETGTPELYNDALQLSGRFHALRRKEIRGILSNNDMKPEHNQITAALLDLLNRME